MPAPTLPPRGAGRVVERAGTAAVALAIATAVAGGALVCDWLVWPDADTAWLLSAARAIAGGARLYSPELMEVNPPTIFALAGGAVAVADLAGLPAVAVWRLLVFAAVLAAQHLCLRRLLRHPAVAPPAVAWPAAVLVAAALACLPGDDFGQREHLVLLLSLPYVLSTAALVDADPWRTGARLAAGALIAVALSLKPHYVLLVFAVEGAGRLMAPRSSIWRAETQGLAVGVTVMAAWLVVVHPGYLTSAVPMALRYYRAYGQLTWPPSYTGFVAVGVLGVWTLRRRMSAAPAAPALLVAAGLGAGVAMLAQGTGWDYTFLPAKALLLFGGGLACLLVLASLDVAQPARRRRSVPAVAALVMAALLAGLMTRRTVNIQRGPRSEAFAALAAVLARTTGGRPIAMASLTRSLVPAFPVAEVAQATWASRYSCLWMLPAIDALERAGGEDPTRDDVRRLAAEVAEDLARRRPNVVLIEAGQSSALDAVLAAPGVQQALSGLRTAARIGTVDVLVRDVE